MSTVAWTVLIVDDHEGFRAGARALLEDEGFEVLGEAGDGESALQQARRLRPQVVLLDVQLPGMDGFAVAESLAEGPSAPAVVLVSSRGRGAYRSRLESTPARGFITKAEFSGECLSSLLD
jgi:DNA-binding NarL/FixJ family response regulator